MFKGPGELKLSLNSNFPASMSILRPPQQDLTVSVAENLVKTEMVESLKSFLGSATEKHTIRNYSFNSISGLRSFPSQCFGSLANTLQLFTNSKKL